MSVHVAHQRLSCPPVDIAVTASRENPINIAIRRSARATLVAAACTAVLAGGLAACGTVQQLSAAGKISDAFGKLGAGKTFSAKLSVDATSAQIVAFGAATGEKIEQQNATALADLSMSFSVSADKPLKDLDSVKSPGAPGGYDALSADKSLNFSYLVAGKGGKALAELRHVGSKSYLKVDVAEIGSLAGEGRTEIGTLQDQIPDGLKVFKDALAGQWISIDPKTLTDFGTSMGLGADLNGGKPSAAPSLDAKTSKQLTDSLKDVLSRNVSFEDKGTKDGADHIVITAPARRLADDLLKSLKPVGIKGLPTAAPTDIPDRTIGVDVYLKKGELSSVSFDLAQLDNKAGPDVHLPVKIAFAKDAPVLQAPAGATELTKSDLDGILSTFAGPRGAGGAAVPFTDAQIKELTDTGISAAEVDGLSKSGISFEQVKKLLANNS